MIKMYKEYEDQELIYLIAESSEEASNILYKKYKNLINLKVKKYLTQAKKVGLDYNDLFQEGMLGLSDAINSYKDMKNTKFSSFANLCIDRQLYTALAKAGRKKHSLLNESFSLDFVSEEDDKPLMNFLFNKTDDPSIKFDNKESKKQLMMFLKNNLTNLEKEVLVLRIKGYEYKEISKILNKSYKSIDSALQRIRNKIKTYL